MTASRKSRINAVECVSAVSPARATASIALANWASGMNSAWDRTSIAKRGLQGTLLVLNSPSGKRRMVTDEEKKPSGDARIKAFIKFCWRSSRRCAGLAVLGTWLSKQASSSELRFDIDGL